MNTYAIGDIHGCLKALKTLVDKANISAADTVVILGDFIDRGADSKGVINLLFELAEFCTVKTLKGNHEIMMLDAKQDRDELTRWLHFGGEQTLDSYNASTFADIPPAHWQFIESTLPYFETEEYIFVHANLDPYVPLNEQSESNLFWQPFNIREPHISEKFVVCGHTAQKSGIPLLTEYGICIDTYAYGNGWLSCMEMNSGNLLQANETGNFRALHINQLSIES